MNEAIMHDHFVEVKGVRQYLVYIYTRVKLIQTDILSVEDNQYRFYLELVKCCKQFASTHQLFYKFILGRCDYKHIMNMLGADNRNTFRFLERQRKKFIEYITQKENELFIQYPFVGEYKWLHEREVI